MGTHSLHQNITAVARHIPSLILLLFIFGVTTIPFRSHFPINHDAAQFVLGVKHFSVHMHQPHPPGYPLFIGLARLCNWAGAPPHTSVLLVTWAFGLGAVCALYWFVFQLWDSRSAAVFSTVAFLLNPLFWYYREVALSYTVDAFATLLIGALTYRAIERSPRAQYFSSIALGLLAGVRPSLFLLLLPVGIFPSLVKRRYRTSLAFLGLFVLTVLLWLVPLVVLSGGPSAYLNTSLKMAALGARMTSVFMGAGTDALLLQFDAVLAIVTGSCNLMLGIALIGGCLQLRDSSRQGRSTSMRITDFVLIACWTLPAFFVFVFVHLGQAGYLLILVPLVYVLPGRAWLGVRNTRTGARRALGSVTLIAILFLHGLSFPLISAPGALSEVQLRPVKLWEMLSKKAPLLAVLNRDVIRRNDLRIEALTAVVRSFPASGAVVLVAAGLENGGNAPYDPQPNPFRSLGTTCPEHRIYDVTPPGLPVLSLHRFQTGYLPKFVNLPNGRNAVLLLIDHIPQDLIPREFEVVRTERFPRFYVGLAEGDFEFLGTRFETSKDPPPLFELQSTRRK